MSAYKLNSPSFRFPYKLEGVHPEVVKAIKDAFNGCTNHEQAFRVVQASIDALEVAQSAAASSTSTNTVITILSTQFPGLGKVNDQTGITAYTVQNSDNGILLLLNDASPVTVTLNSVVTPPYFFFITNFGGGVVTLTPTTGTVNVSSIPQGYFGEVVFDGTNWKISAITTATGLDFSQIFMLMGA